MLGVTDIMAIFKFFESIVWSNIFITAVVFGIQEIWRMLFFSCPCTQYMIYSIAMTCAPTVLLLGVGFMSSDHYWHAVLTRRGMRSYKQRCNFCLKSMSRLLQPLLAPTVFLVSVLLRGEFYVCARMGAQRDSNICDNTKQDERFVAEPSPSHYDIKKFYTQSQLLGCGILAAVAILTTGIDVIRRLCFSGCLPDEGDYRRYEEEALETAFHQRLREAINKEAQTTVDEAFQGEEGRSTLVVYRQAWEHVSNLYKQSTVGTFIRLTHAEDGQSAVRIVDSTL